MTVQTSTSVANFSGNGVATVFPFSFKFNDDSDLTVLLTDATERSVRQLTLNSDYTAQGAKSESGGSVTLVIAPPVGKTLRVLRMLDILQITSLRNQGKFLAETHEDVFDTLTMIAQQQQEQISRSLTVPPYSDETSDDLIGSIFDARDSAAESAVEAGEIADKFGDVDYAVDASQSAAVQSEAARALAFTSSLVAQSASAVAQTAADSAHTSAKIYANTAAGLVATAEGAYFSVPSADSDEYLILYRKVSGAAVEIKRYPSAEIVQSVAARTVAISGVNASIIPVVVTDDGKIVIWLKDGNLSARGISPELDAEIFSGRIASVAPTANIHPVVVAGNQVAVWLQGGLLGAKGLAPSLMTAIVASAKEYGAPRNAPLSSNLPVATDGRTLTTWRGKLGKKGAGTNQKFKIGMTGDSWCELLPIPVQLRAHLTALLGNAGEGWQNVVPNPRFGSSLSLSGWTTLDASTGAAMIYKSGPDGMCIYAASASATLSMSALTATDITIFYLDTAGTFRWRVDGGPWTTVTGGNTSNTGRVTISGLTDSAHTLEVDTTGNADVVVIYGFYTTRSAGSGIEISRMGNGGLQSQYMLNYLNFDGSMLVDIGLDIMIVIMGTNDYRLSGNPPEVFIDAMNQLANKFKVSSPNTGLIFVYPADTDGAELITQPKYRDALYSFCIENGHEFYNMYDNWSTFSNENANGQFNDILHVNDAGAARLALELSKSFLLI